MKAIVCRAISDDIGALAAEGKIRPHVHATLPLARAVDALRLLQARAVIGKVVLTM